MVVPMLPVAQAAHLILDLKISIRLHPEIALVKVMHAHETILSSRREAVAFWRDRDAVGVSNTSQQTRGEDRGCKYRRVDWPEVAFYPPDLFFKDLVPEARLELALAKRRRRHTHGILSTTEQNLWTGVISDSRNMNCSLRT